jgi:hypothetical protein
VSLFPDASEPKLAPDAPSGLGRAILGAAGAVDRRRNDFYPTPAEATAALLRVEAFAIRRALHDHQAATIWEPCGRGGAIATVLESAGFAVCASDIVGDPPHDVEQLDLLLTKEFWSPVAFTNPPFALAADMIRHLLGTLGVKYLALLLKSTFWSAAARAALLERYPPARRYDLNWRLDFTGGGAPTMECSWFVWDASASDYMNWAVLSRDGAADLPLLGAA